MSPASREAEVVLDPNLPLVRITREFDAPPAKVFRAHSEPALFVKWIGPEKLETAIDRWDCRTGGEYRYIQREAGEEYAFRGCFHEVRKGAVIVQTFAFEGFADSVSLDRLEFSELPGGRCQLVSTSLLDSFESRDAFVAAGMEVGIQEGYRKLDRLLVELG